MKIKRIGIAGLMGAGKSTCVGFFADALRQSSIGVRIIDADVEAKIMMRQDKSLQEGLIASFGKEVVRNGEIVFSLLGALSFSALPRLLTLNGIVHPPLLERLRELVFSRNAEYIICDAALISLWHVEKWFDTCIWVDASFEKRYERLIKKLTLTPDELKTRMEMQRKIVPEPEKTQWKIINNNGKPDELRLSCSPLIKDVGGTGFSETTADFRPNSRGGSYEL
jgi:dephospho-CoA kinase